MTDDYLFAKPDLGALIRAQEAELLKEIDSYPTNGILNTNLDELCDFFYKKYLLPPPTLNEEEINTDQEDTEVDVSQDTNRVFLDRGQAFYIKGTRFRFYVPFTGDKDLFYYQPSTYTLNPPRGTVDGEELIFTYTHTNESPETIQASFQSDLGSVKSYLTTVANNVEPFNSGLKALIRGRIEGRKHKLVGDQQISSSFGYRIRQRSDSGTYRVPDVKRVITTDLQRPPTRPASPLEPTIGMEDYEHILSTIGKMSRSMELSPEAFRGLTEENIRHFFLMILNGQYEADVSGETFNLSGKTDIIVRREGKNLFIAECKFWKGPKYLLEAIDQLLGYTSWRDSKTAILIFNRSTKMTEVLKKIPDVVHAHLNFVRDIEYVAETGFRFVMHSLGDNEREVFMTVLVFDVPVQETPMLHDSSLVTPLVV